MKRAIRKEVKEKRANFFRTQRSKAKADVEIFKKIHFHPEIYQKDKVIFGYYSMHKQGEVDTVLMIEYALKVGVRIALPKVIGDNLLFLEVKSLKDVEESSIGIMEPKYYCEVVNEPNATVIMPGVAFDRGGNRIGYGGGYYDRFLAKEPNHKKIALTYDFQIYDILPMEKHDIKVDEIITEKEIIKCK